MRQFGSLRELGSPIPPLAILAIQGNDLKARLLLQRCANNVVERGRGIGVGNLPTAYREDKDPLDAGIERFISDEIKRLVVRAAAGRVQGTGVRRAPCQCSGQRKGKKPGKESPAAKVVGLHAFGCQNEADYQY